jgi:glycosyltransferase involved in cell wall biosynthesis
MSISKSLNVVVVNAEFPYPPTAGNRIRTLNLLSRLAKRHRITFIARRGQPDETAQAVEFLGDQGFRTVVVDEPLPRKSGPLFQARLALNLLSPLPYSVASHSGPRFRETVTEFGRNKAVDLWQAEWTPYIDAFAGLPEATRLVIAHNVESQIWQRYHETELHPLRRWYIGQQWRKFEAFERRAFAQANRIVAVSRQDAQIIRNQFGVRTVDVVDNGIDREYFSGTCGGGDPRRILFLGGFDWRPNLDAVSILLDQVFPRVRAVEPSALLSLVGRRPPESLLQKVRSLEGVELFADVPDVRPHLADSGVMVVPLRIGGGSRLKILEALATGLPVVSTRVGAEGLELEPGRHFLPADTVEDMVETLIEVIRHPDAARVQATSACQFVRDRYDWDMLADKLETIWMECVGGLQSHRAEACPR